MIGGLFAIAPSSSLSSERVAHKKQRTGALLVMQVAAKPDFFSVELEGRPTHVYNESAFQYFLSVERKRTERSGRPFALVLLERTLQADAGKRIDDGIATKIFSGLSLCLRETDFIGWFQEGVVAGAVLTHLGETSGSDVTHQIRRRIRHMVIESLLPELTERISLRIYHLPAQEHELGENRS